MRRRRFRTTLSSSGTLILVRAARTYLQSVLGLMTAGGLGLDSGMLPHDVGRLLLTSLQLALAPAIYTVLHEGIDVLAKLDPTSADAR